MDQDILSFRRVLNGLKLLLPPVVYHLLTLLLANAAIG